MEFGILGPLRVVTEDGEQLIGSAKARSVLGLLVVHANEVVSTDAIIGALWEDVPPRSAVTTVQTYVYQLRKTLDLAALRTRPTGYTLEVPRAAVDALRFEDLLGHVSGEPQLAPRDVVSLLGEALGSWRGQALADFTDAAWARTEATRLEMMRLDAIERVVDARLALGEHRAVAPELEALVAEHPLRERFWGQLMLALYRGDRQADALRAYATLRTYLRDELGLEPSRDLMQLEGDILQQSPDLALAISGEDTPAGDPIPIDPPAEADSPRRRNALALAIAVGTAAVAAAVVVWIASNPSTHSASAPRGYRPVYRRAACPTVIEQGDTSVQCGVLTVPENRSRPGGRTIELGVFRFPARTAHPTSDPVVQLGSEFRLAEPPEETALRSRSDSIYLSGRGFFGSVPRLTCPEINQAVNAALGRRLRDPRNTREFAAAAGRCHARWVAHGVDPSAYSASERADDVRDLAQAMHLRQINLVADGVTTSDASDIAGRYPKLVRSVTLFNVTPTGVTANPWNGKITNAAAALDRLVQECASQTACNARFPHLRSQIIDVYNRLEQHPPSYPVADPYNPRSRPIPILLDGDRGLQLALLALDDDPSALTLIPEAFASAASGPAVADFAAGRLISTTNSSWGALLSRVCVDEFPNVGLGGLSLEGQAEPRLAFLADDPLLHVCNAWPVTPAPAHDPAPGAVPALILQGTLDPFTSSDWAHQVGAAFGGATVVELPHLGRVASSTDSCVIRLRRSFLADPHRPIDADSCARHIPPVHFAGT